MISKRNIKQLTLLGSILSIFACSSGSGSLGGSSPDNGNAGSLQIITPKTIYSRSGTTGTGYVVINNPTESAVKGLQYSLTNPIGSGSNVSVDPVSSAACATVTAYGRCNVKITVPAGAVAGSIGFTASNGNTSLLDKLGKSVKAVAPALTIGIEQAAYNSIGGADGITLSYFNTVINGVPYVLVSGLVASDKAGTFNKIVLVNGSGAELPNQQLIGAISNALGSTFNILLPVPAGNNASQTIRVRTQQVTDGKVTAESTAMASSTLTTRENVGIAEMLPSAVYLTPANPEQIITFSNTGDAVAQLQQLVSNNPNVEAIFNPISLNSGTITTAILRLKNTAVAATTGNVTLTYNNSQSETTTSGTVDQNISPSLGPKPTPAPESPPIPIPGIAGLTAIISPDNDFFKTSAGMAVTRQLTLTNTGNTTESDIILTLPAGFTVSDGISNSCANIAQTGSTATISNALTTMDSSESCDMTVAYTNSMVTSLTAADISIAYKYDHGISAPTLTTAVVEYQVTQSTANLVLQSPISPFAFPATLFDGASTTDSQLFNIKNTGEETATDITVAVNSTTIAGLFDRYTSGVVNECTGTLAPDAECNIGVQFGPIPDNIAAGSKEGDLGIEYKQYSSTTSTTALTPVPSFSGQVATSGSPVFNAPASGTSGSGYTGTWPDLSINQNITGAGALITYTITNTGSDAATDFVVTLPSAPAGWNAPATNCPITTGTNLAPNASCTISIPVNTTTPGTVAATNMVVGLAWKDQASPSGTTQNMQLGLPGVTVVALPSPIFNTPTSGAPGDGYIGTWPNLSIIQNTTGADALITYTIKNTGNDTATDFVVTLPSAPAGWNVPATNCPTTAGTNLAQNASCTISIPVNTATAGVVVATNMTVGLAWEDQLNPSGTTQNILLGLPKVTVIAVPPQIILVTPAIGSIQVATNVSISITFSEPMDTSTIIPDDTIYIDSQYAYSYESPIFTHGNKTVTIPLATGETLGIKQPHSIIVDQTQIKSQSGAVLGSDVSFIASYFITLDGGVIFVSSSSHNGNYGGEPNLDNVCKSEGASKIPTAVWQAMLTSDRVTSDANYYLFDSANSANYYRGTLIGLGGNLAPAASPANEPNALNAVIPGSGTYWYSTGYAYPGTAGSLWGTNIGSCENIVDFSPWSSSATTQQSFYGRLNSTTPYLNLNQADVSCTTHRYLICVQI